MRVLLTSNVVHPRVAALVGMPETPFGGWLSTNVEVLKELEGVKLAVAMKSPLREPKRLEFEGVTYFFLAAGGRSRFDSDPSSSRRVIEEWCPDIVHVEGTEMAFVDRLLVDWRGPLVVSLQGVLKGYSRFYLGSATVLELLTSAGLRGALVGAAYRYDYHASYRGRVDRELRLIGRADVILGRTEWDRSHAWVANSEAKYVHCPRVVRDPFWEESWHEESSIHGRVFVGNMASPLKGGHIALQALKIVKSRMPCAHMVVGGLAPHPARSVAAKKDLSWRAVLAAQTRRLGLEDAVNFLGVLKPEQVAKEMRQARVVALPSLIENSPNTVAEAMTLGAPVVAASCGGVPSMVRDGEEGLLYRAEEPEQLAAALYKVLEDRNLRRKLGAAARVRAERVHQKSKIRAAFLRAYETALQGGKC